MAQLTLHFEADPQADLRAAAASLGAQAGRLAEVDAAEARPEQVQAVGVSEILLALTVASSLIGNSANVVDGLTRLVHSIKAFAAELGLRKARVEIGLRQVPVDELTPDDLREWAED